jgi:hypothetical protein
VWTRLSDLSLYIVLLARTDRVRNGLACLGCMAIPLNQVLLLLLLLT